MTQKNSKPAHHVPRGGFRNPWPGGQQESPVALLKWMWQRWTSKDLPKQPDASAFERVAPSFATPRLDARSLSATWVGHSTLLLQVGALNVLVDPVWSDRVSPVPLAGPRRWVAPGVALDALPPLDVILVSHNHYDHFDAPTLRRLAALHPAARWHVPLGLAREVTALGARHVVEQDWWDEARLTSDDASTAEAWVGCTPAQHFSARGMHDRDRTLWCGWTVRTAEWRVYFAGDSGWFPEFGAIARRFGPFDLAAIPIGAYQPRWFMQPVHMDPDEALRAWEAIVAEQPGHECPLLPIHWGTFKLTDEAMDEPPRRVREKWAWEGRNQGLLWLLRHGETRMKTR